MIANGHTIALRLLLLTLMLGFECIFNNTPIRVEIPVSELNSNPLAKGKAIIVGLSRAIQHQKDDRTFRIRAHELSKALKWPIYTIQTGKELIQTLVSITQKSGNIESIILLSHGDSLCLVLNTDNGFYRDQTKQPHFHGIYGGGNNQAFVSDLQTEVAKNRILFHPKATVALLSCHGIPLAKDIQYITKGIVIAATDSCEPVIHAQNGQESGYYGSHSGFYLIESESKRSYGAYFNPSIYFQFQNKTKMLNRQFGFQLPIQL